MKASSSLVTCTSTTSTNAQHQTILWLIFPTAPMKASSSLVTCAFTPSTNVLHQTIPWLIFPMLKTGDALSIYFCFSSLYSLNLFYIPSFHLNHHFRTAWVKPFCFTGPGRQRRPRESPPRKRLITHPVGSLLSRSSKALKNSALLELSDSGGSDLQYYGWEEAAMKSFSPLIIPTEYFQQICHRYTIYLHIKESLGGLLLLLCIMINWFLSHSDI